jgi:hypothetical protein
MRNIKLITLVLSILFMSCELGNFGEEFQVDPNSLSPENADPNFVLNNIQLEFENLLSNLDNQLDEIMRYKALMDTYAEQADQDQLNSEWSNYFTFLEDAKVLESLADNNADLLYHKGVSKIITSYATVIMVDVLGDIPFSEANKAVEEGIFNPKTDSGMEIYQELLIRLDGAISDLNAATFSPLNDLYYDGDSDKWVKLANSLKLKMLLNLEDTAGINTLIAEGNLITDSSDDFQFNYGTQTNPSSIHPNFGNNYINDLSGSYVSNSFLNVLLNSKSVRDPRLRYYIFRQASIDPPSTVLPCQGNTQFDFCYLGDAYFGRDHGDLRPFSSDFQFRCILGLYPVGGAFDSDNAASSSNGIVLAQNAPTQNGAGIFPILMSSFVDFLRAEAAIKLGTTDNAASLLESGIRKSISKVVNFSSGVETFGFATNASNIDAYVSEVLTKFQNTNDRGKLDVIMEEYYIAAFGNSLESYNTYRRTGFPSSLQTPVLDASSPFPRTFPYPSNAVNSNSSINQKPITTQVFWDKNPAGFIE